MALSSLPDDVLLELFRYLKSRQLLLARGVCRRWRDLALDPLAWKHRSLRITHLDDVAFQHAVLSLVPSLQGLYFEKKSLQRMALGAGAAWRELARVSATTTCAVRCLFFFLKDDDWRLASRILRRQLALPSSRLRSLSVHLVTLQGSLSAALLDLLEVLKAAPCLAELTLKVGDVKLEWPAAVPYEVESNAHLKTLKYISNSGAPNPFLELLVRKHLETLESVRFDSGDFAVFSLLGLCPKLTDVVCRYNDGISELLHSRSLRKLTVKWRRFEYWNIWEVLPLKEVLNVPGQPSVETIELWHLYFISEYQWEGLGATLAGLPQLHSVLLVNVAPPPCFLRCISPRTAPSLRLLHVSVAIQCARRDIRCGTGPKPALEYLAELRAALHRNPGLHVSGLLLAGQMCESDGCGLEGPQGLPGAPVGKEFGVYSHVEGQQCDLHRDGDTWLRLDCDGVSGLEGRFEAWQLCP